MPTMITRSATKNVARKSVKAALGPLTDRVLVEQMTIVKSILLRAPVDLKQLSNQCLLLSKILDFLVANNRKPSQRHDLLPLVQQVCKYKDKPDARPALLILLLSVKSAFRAEWLSTLEVSKNDEIFVTLNSLFDSFTTGDQISAQSSLQPLQCGGSAVNDAQEALEYLASITKRFYPRLLINAVFVALQAKVGYEILVCDFHVPRMNIQDRVFLYVGKRDSVETAACLITPSQVRRVYQQSKTFSSYSNIHDCFLVNGQQVEKRVNSGYVDGSPQMPSDVTRFVKVGANVLQVIGEFSEPHVIAMTSSRALECSAKTTQLEDYVAPTIAASCEVDSDEVDDEVVEGASRLSLRCPISHQRLVTPVKGTACRHLQCFDYGSFLEINEKRPAWRCPCCNRFMSCLDLRVDRHMERILKVTDEKIHEVIISQDGSWVPVSPGENQINNGPNETCTESGEIANAVIDLSDISDEEVNGERMDIDEFQLPDKKPDKETLKAINENGGNPPQATNLGIVNIPDITASAARSLSNNAGPLRAGFGSNRNNRVHIEPATNHNIQAPYSQSGSSPHSSSPAGDVNRSAPSSGNTTSTQQQQPQIRAPSNTGVGSRGESGRIQQRQSEQQPPRIQQQGQQQPPSTQRRQGEQQPPNTQQWQGEPRTQQQGGQQPPRTPQAHVQATQPQWRGSGNPQQMHPRPWGGPPGGPHPCPPPAAAAAQQILYESAAAMHRNWRPAQRMRGSVANPFMVGHWALGPVPHVHPMLPGMDPVLAMQFQMRMPPPGNLYAMPPFPRGPPG